LHQTHPQIAIASIDWAKFSSTQSERSRSFFALLAPQTPDRSSHPSRTPFQHAIEPIAPGDRRAFLQEYLRKEVAAVMGSEASDFTIEPSQGFFDRGMDSLMLVELKNRLEKALAYSLPSTIVFEFPTVLALSEYIATQVLKWDTAPEPIKMPPNLLSVEPLLEEDMEAALQRELLELQSLLRDDGNG
jgi:acyl carrier protein